METFALLALTIVSLGALAWAFAEPERLIQYPFFVALVFAGWVLPQLIGLTQDPFLPDGALVRTALFGTACLLAVFAGYRVGNRPGPTVSWQLDNQLLYVVSVVLMLIGAYFWILVRVQAAEATEEYSGQWSGIITIYFFFSRLLSYALVLSIVGYVQRPSNGWAVMILIGAAFYLDRIVSFGRRSELVELLIVASLLVWFHRRFAPSRILVALASVAMVLVVHGVGQYRAFLDTGDATAWGELLEIDFAASFREVIEHGGDELRNAAYTISATARTGSYDWGASMWNAVVVQYVPAQLVGLDTKLGLMLQQPDSAYEQYGHIPWTGTTPTGLGDAFASWGYLGFLKFFAIAYVIGRLWASAREGRQAAQVLLLVLMTPAVQSVTHSTNWFVKDLPQVALFLLLPLYYARTRQEPVRLAGAGSP